MKERVFSAPAVKEGAPSPVFGNRPRFPYKLSPIFLLLPLLCLLMAGAGGAAEISQYKVIRKPVTDKAGKLRIAIRSFKSGNDPHLLVVDPDTLQSFDVPASSVNAPGSPAEARVSSTRFSKAIRKYTGGPHRLQNDGATRSDAALHGCFLTVDLCPSRRPFEREMFGTVAGLSKGAPVPVAVAITGLWMASHPEELAYLKGEVAAGRLAITWVNHSYHHPYEPKVPLERNFLLTPGTDFLHEVLDVEQQLLARGLVPSPFFRFPGLVSDGRTMQQLEELSLIPIGSDAWLAKGESPRDGSFILVHGNGNEPKGIKLLMPMLREKRLRLLPLAAAFGG